MFKKLMLAGVAASMVAAPTIAAAAPQQHRQVVRQQPNRTVIVNRGPGYRERTVVRHNNNRQWARGQRFDRRYANNYRQIDYRSYRNRGVYAPPRGYQWVQSGNDAVLVALASGLIGAVIGGAIR
jgi:Ni/Co efflux regulator RcnB